MPVSPDSVPIWYFGTTASLPKRTPLRAGPLSLLYENGSVRSICLGDRPLLSKVYVAVRDQNWGTVPGVITDEVILTSDAAFSIRFTSTHEEGDILFQWQGALEGGEQVSYIDPLTLRKGTHDRKNSPRHGYRLGHR